MKENEELKSSNEQLHKEVNDLKTEITSIKKQNEEFTSYSRRNNLVINGLKPALFSDVASVGISSQESFSVAASNESVTKLILELFNGRMNLNVTENDISKTHRLSSNRNDMASSTRTVPPIIVCFVRRSTRDQVYAARKMLKSTARGVFINEHLTPGNSLIFARARLLVKQNGLTAAFTQAGSVLVKTTKEQQERARKVTNLNDLELLSSPRM